MLKVRALAVATMLIVVSLFSLTPASAKKGCVTPKEFAKAKTGMSVSAVAKLFGTNGNVMAESEAFGIKVVMRDYKACTTFGAVSVMFSNGKLESKSGIF